MRTPGPRLAAAIEGVEQLVLAILFAAMVIVTFVQVVLRYVFNSGLLWAVEFTSFCFAWLVLLGASYGIKHRAHLGVDAFVRLLPEGGRRTCALLAVLASLLYATIMLYGAWDYVTKLYRIGIHAIDLPVPRWIPYSALVIGMVLLILRLLQAGWRILEGRQTSILADEARHTVDEALGGAAPARKA